MHLRAFAVVLAAIVLAGPCRAADRRIVPLDGAWSIAEGGMETMPARFDRQVPVPGFVDMAQPPFREVGTPEGAALRKAFWYRRTFTVPGPATPTALLRIRKACFGTAVWLNGTPLGLQYPSFTPTYWDLRQALKTDGRPNELVVRVGVDRSSLPVGVPNGRDFEKSRYIAGIYDSVDLVLTGAPRITEVQAVPDVAARTVRAQVRIAGVDRPIRTPIAIVVTEARSGKVAARATAQVEVGRSGGLALVPMRLAGCHPWTPEDPFLYRITVSTSADSVTDRFGMRTFCLDPRTGRAILNGKPYYMRGSNVTFFRFAEDPRRGGKPWDRRWVRMLHRRFKQVHWNCLRYCIGFPPELWYDIADEEGILIQDEFPVWGVDQSPKDPDAAHLVAEYSDWMRDRWNHPCVAIWDAQNETISTETGKAIHAVRKLDLSNRPWDNGWSPADAPGDSRELHPYHYQNPAFTPDQVALDPGTLGWKPGSNPIIINEYGWLWLNRDGTPTTLTTQVFRNLLGENSTTIQRRNLAARLFAAETEFWRARRACAAVIHFCGLTYSRPGGATCDNWTDIDTLAWDPEFIKYVPDSFAPVGVMVDFFATEIDPGARLATPVQVTNDLPQPWRGQVRLTLAQGERVLATSITACRAGSQGIARLPLSLTAPREPGDYRITAELLTPGRPTVRSLRDFSILTPAQKQARHGLAVGCKAIASSSLKQDGATRAEAAVDGQGNTRWSSDFSDPQWIAVDLGSSHRIGRVTLSWEAACAAAYRIEVSQDGTAWTPVYSTENGQGGQEVIRFAPVEARWVRLYGTRRATRFGYSLWEFGIFPPE